MHICNNHTYVHNNTLFFEYPEYNGISHYRADINENSTETNSLMYHGLAKIYNGVNYLCSLFKHLVTNTLNP